MVAGRFVLAAPFSGAGKTTATLALCGALARRGADVRPFKTGPDFVDGRFHEAACGKTSHNLDLWLLGRDVRAVMSAYGDGGLSVVEGVMGLYDGLGSGEEYSTARLAQELDAPVVLLVPAAGMGASVRALVEGYVNHCPGLIRGLYLTQVSGKAHADLLSRSLASSGLPLVGWLPKVDRAELPHRGIGLQAPDDLARRVELLVQAAEEGLNFDVLAETVRRPPLQDPPARPWDVGGLTVARLTGLGFCGDYSAGLDRLKEGGARVIDFGPGDSLPQADLLWMRAGGVLDDLKSLPSDWVSHLGAHRGKLWAEGLGALLACRAVTFADGSIRPMAGLVPTEGLPVEGRRTFGYGTVMDEHPWPCHRLCNYRLAENSLTERRASTGQLRPAGWRDKTHVALTAHGHPISQQAALMQLLA